MDRMLPENSPFPCHWWGPGLAVAGLGEQRPDHAAYGRSEFERLPPLPFPTSGDFAWLAAAPAHRHSIRTKYGADIAGSFEFLRTSSDGMGVRLPDAFTKFMQTPSLQDRVRSATDCYIDLCPEPVRSPLGDGWLVHFLADSQGCLFWYLYLTADGSDHAVVTSPDYYSTPVEPLGDYESDSDDEEWEEDEPDPAAISFCAESFEAFLARYWLENEILFAQCQKTPMPEAGRRYIEDYRRRQ
jgi:hypothetical protein